MSEPDDDQAGAQATTAYALIGGDARVRALVDRFYDLMDLESSYTELFGHPRLRARHMPFAIGIKERDQWVACMAQAMSELDVDPVLATRLRESFMQTADWMRNKGV
jgi:hemoglobin